MSRYSIILLALSAVLILSCRAIKETRTYKEPPPPQIIPTTINFVDSEGFDVQLETALINQDPVILIQTPYPTPEWGRRLNAWIAAWNMGGKVEPPKDPRIMRGQSPLGSPVTVDAESIREFRLLIEVFMNRGDVIISRSAAWLTEEKIRNRRVELLRQYNLRFHQDVARNIQLILFNGNYSQHYNDWVRSIAHPSEEDMGGWHRNFTCSRCKYWVSEAVE